MVQAWFGFLGLWGANLSCFVSPIPHQQYQCWLCSGWPFLRRASLHWLLNLKNNPQFPAVFQDLFEQNLIVPPENCFSPSRQDHPTTDKGRAGRISSSFIVFYSAHHMTALQFTRWTFPQEVHLFVVLIPFNLSLKTSILLFYVGENLSALSFPQWKSLWWN